MADGAKERREVVVIVRDEEYDGFNFGEVDRVVKSGESERYIGKIEDRLMKSYRIDDSSGREVNTRLCDGLNTSYTATEGLYDSPITIFVIENGARERVIGQLSIDSVIFEEGKRDTLEVKVLCGYPGKKGIGSYLIGKLEEICRANGIKKLVLDSVIPAVGFYEKVGFKVRDDYEDTVRMVKRIR